MIVIHTILQVVTAPIASPSYAHWYPTLAFPISSLYDCTIPSVVS